MEGFGARDSMTSDKILAMPVEEVFRKVAEILWPWDESCCRVCGWTMGEKDSDCKPGDCRYIDSRLNFRADDSRGWNLQSWDSVGRMVEAMRERGQWFIIGGKFMGKYRAEFSEIAHSPVEAPTPWESCARACLLALVESD